MLATLGLNHEAQASSTPSNSNKKWQESREHIQQTLSIWAASQGGMDNNLWRVWEHFPEEFEMMGTVVDKKVWQFNDIALCENYLRSGPGGFANG